MLEEAYWSQREGTLAGKLSKQRLGFIKKSEADAPSPPEGKGGDEYTFGADRADDTMKSGERPNTGKVRASDNTFFGDKSAKSNKSRKSSRPRTSDLNEVD